jgi:hypothetical protein
VGDVRDMLLGTPLSDRAALVPCSGSFCLQCVHAVLRRECRGLAGRECVEEEGNVSTQMDDRWKVCAVRVVVLCPRRITVAILRSISKGWPRDESTHSTNIASERPRNTQQLKLPTPSPCAKKNPCLFHLQRFLPRHSAQKKKTLPYHITVGAEKHTHQVGRLPAAGCRHEAAPRRDPPLREASERRRSEALTVPSLVIRGARGLVLSPWGDSMQ